MVEQFQKLVQNLSIVDLSHREESLQCFSKAQKSIFSTSLVSEIIAQQMPTDTVVQCTFIEHCFQEISTRISVEDHTERILMVTKWLKNKMISYLDAITSSETFTAFHVLADQSTTDKQFEINAEYLQRIVELIDVRCICVDHEIEENLFYNVMQLRLVFPMLTENKSENLCKLFTAIGEKIVQKSDQNPPRLFLLIDVLLACAFYQNLIELTFPFWKQLAKSVTSEQRGRFQIAVEKFMLMLTMNCRYPNIDKAAMDTPCFENDFAIFRDHVALLVEDLVPFLNLQRTFGFYLLKLQENNLSYEDVEACLFMISCFADRLDVSEYDLVPQFLAMVFKLDENSQAPIVYMCLKVLKEMTPWINVHHLKYLTTVLNFLLKFINVGGACGSAATETLAEICCVSTVQMQFHIHHLFEIVEGIDKCCIHKCAEMNFIRGVAMVVFSLPSDQQLYEAMKHLCELQFKRISMHQDNALIYIDQLAEIFHNVPRMSNESNPAALVFCENWIRISKMLEYYQDDAAVMKKIVECIRCAVYNIGIAVHPVLESVVKQLLFVYCMKKYHFILRCMNVITSTLGSHDNLVQGLFISFQGLCIATFNGLHEESDFNADIMDEFFQLSTTCVTKMPMQLLKSPLVLKIIDFAINSCELNRKNINKSALIFLLSIITCNRCHRDIETCVMNALTKYSEPIVTILTRSSFFVFDSSLLADVVNIFYEVKIKSNQGFNELFVSAVNKIPLRNSAGCRITAVDRIQQIINSIARPNITKLQIVSDLTLLRNIFR